ncbi:hypothetical protein Tco_1064057, partial [Tanacetum coccineum]
GRTSADTEILLEQEEPTELVEDLGSGEKGEKEISTTNLPESTASAIPEVSTAIPERQVYIRRNEEKRKDKEKAIMKEDEFVQKKSKKQLKQEILRHMTGNKSYLRDYQDIDGGFVAFAGSPKGGKITGKGKIRTGEN